MNLIKAQQDFIAHFGEMGSRWGINRTVGQIYALLYVSPKPLCAEDIADILHISRSNVSISIKELDSWRIIRTKHIRGDRKDYFTVPDDIWDIVRNLAEQRFKREVEPTLSLLRDVLLECSCDDEDEKENCHFTSKKLQDMHDLIEMFSQWHNEMQKVETSKLVKLMKLGTKIFGFLDFKIFSKSDDKDKSG